MAERILVTGAAGELGREVVMRLAKSGCVVRAATLDPSAARGLFPPDIEVVELDFDRTETYDAAAMWVDRMLLMPPPFDPDVYGTINPFLDWAVSTDVERVVLLSAMDAETMPELALRKVEQHLENLDVTWTILRPNLFMQNFTSGFILERIRADGTFELCAGNGRVSFVDVRDVADVAEATLRYDGHHTRAYTLTGPESSSFTDAAELIAEAAGRSVTYHAVKPDRMREILQSSGWPLRQAAVGVGLFEAVGRGRREPVREDLHAVLGRPPRAFPDFVRERAEVWR